MDMARTRRKKEVKEIVIKKIGSCVRFITNDNQIFHVLYLGDSTQIYCPTGLRIYSKDRGVKVFQ